MKTLSACLQQIDDGGDVFGEGGKTGHISDVGFGVVAVEADEGGMGKPLRHLLEGETDNARGVVANAKLQQQQVVLRGTMHVVGVAARLLVPMEIFDKGVVNTQVQ